MTLIYLMIIFEIIWFGVYYNYISSIVELFLYLCMESYSAHLMVPWVSGRHSVSVVLIPCFPAIAPYILGHVVDHGGDSSIESFVVHSPNVGLVEPGCLGCYQVLFLIFLSDVHQA